MLAQMILLICLSVTTAHGDLCAVQSTNHGGGLFSYTFQRGDEPYVWGLGTSFGIIELQCYGVREVQSPPGWNHSVSSSGRITWTVTNGLVFLDEPVTFSVRSCLTEAATYRTTAEWGPEGPLGYIAGVAFTAPGHVQTINGGIQYVEFIGPTLPTLSIERASPDVIIRWPAEAQGLQLEAVDQLAVSASWRSVTNLPMVVNSMYEVRLPATNAAMFFRLVTSCDQ
jgi:hypothetical protein